MDMAGLIIERGAGAQELIRATVACVDRDGAVEVVREGDGGGRLTCDLLETSAGETLLLGPGDAVLVWAGIEHAGRGVVLGRILPSSTARVREAKKQDTPDELVLEAKHSLTLRVGDGSITIREDGKILIKGKDLVSHAKRLNRIKGGAVQIN